MKICIRVDIEGITGAIDWDEVMKKPDCSEFPEHMAVEGNATQETKLRITLSDQKADDIVFDINF